MTGGLIVATGKTDHSNPFVPERMIGKISALERMVLLLQMSGIRRIAVVGDEKEWPKKLVPSMNLVFLTASSEGEMMDGVRQGIDFLQEQCTEILVSHVNVPMFSEKTVRMLLEAEGEVCIPCCQRRCGHPILLREGCFSRLLAYQGENGLRGAIEASGIHPNIIETDDIGILSDKKTGTSYEGLSKNHDIRKMTALVQLRIRREKVFYGPGSHQLLQLTETEGSLANACQRMGISYTKGRRIISVMEEQLGKPVLETGQGGKRGGYSHLTESARQMMDSYTAFQEEAEDAVQKLFQKHFQKISEELESERE